MNSTSRLCGILAGPFLHIHDENTTSIFWISFTIISILLTCLIRILVLGYVLRSPPTPIPTNVDPMPCPRCDHLTDVDLPPHQVEISPTPIVSTNPTSTYQEMLAADEKRLLVLPTIPRFIVCTILTVANITAIMLLAFDIQAFLYCGSELTQGTPITNRQQTTYAVTMWIVYAITVIWASSGTLCWLIWARNLWGGKEAAEKWPIQTDYGGVIFIGCLVGVPCMVVLAILLIALIPAALANALWVRIRKKRVNAVEAGEVERGIACESGIEMEGESFIEKESE